MRKLILILTIGLYAFGIIAPSTLLLPQVAYAQTQNSQSVQWPEGYEPYSVRPDILRIKAQRHDLGESWELLKRSHINFVALLSELYKDHEIYFLARDSETLYDLTRLIYAGSQRRKSIRLLSVSRINQNSENLVAYLHQSGITPQKLAAGKKIMMIDTGFFGSIILDIASKFPEYPNSIRGHMILSRNPIYPSSRTFLLPVYPSVNHAPIGLASTWISAYETMPRMTDRSIRIESNGDSYEPIHRHMSMNRDGKVDKNIALKVMQDLKAYWEQPSTKREFQRLQKLVRELVAIVTSKTLTEAQARAKFKGLQQAYGVELTNTFLLDILETKINLTPKINFSDKDFGLKLFHPPVTSANLQYYRIAEPQLIPFFDHPQEYTEKLIANEKWDELREILQFSLTIESLAVPVVDSVFARFEDGPRREMQTILAKQESEAVQGRISQVLGAIKLTPVHKELFETMIRNSTALVPHQLAPVFANPTAANYEDVALLVLSKTGTFFNRSLYKSFLIMPHTRNWYRVMDELIERNDERILQSFIMDALGEPRTPTLDKLINVAMEKLSVQTGRQITKTNLCPLVFKEW